MNAWTDLPVCDYRFGVYKRDEGSLFQLAFCYPYLEYYTNGGWCLDPPEYTFENRNPELADYHVTVEAPESFLVAGPGTVKRDGTRTTVDAEALRDLAIYVSDFMDVDTFEVEGVKIENYYLKTTGEEEFSAFLKDVYTSYRLKIADTKGVLELLIKHNDSEEIRKLIEFYFSGDIVNELFAS